MKKRVIAFLLVLVFVLAACAKGNNQAKNENKENNIKVDEKKDKDDEKKDEKEDEVVDDDKEKEDEVIDEDKEDEEDKVQFTKDDKLVAFTFDDGPSIYTDTILDAFKEVNGHATFFVIGNRTEEYKSQLQREVDEGHLVGNHSWDHPDLTKLDAQSIKNQLTQTADKVKELTNGYEIRVCRPTYGAVNDTVKACLRELSYPAIIWDVDTRDWEHRNRDKLYNVLMNDIKPGDIVLMHDIYESTRDGVTRALKELASQGYHFVTVEDMYKAYGEDLEPGTMHFQASSN